MDRKVCRAIYYSHGNMAEKLRNNFHDRDDAIRWRPTSWEEQSNRTGSVCQNPCVSLRIPVMPAFGGGWVVSWLPGRALTLAMEGETRRGGEAVREQKQPMRIG